MDKLLKLHRFNFNQPEESQLTFDDTDWLGDIFDSLESITDTDLGDEKDSLEVELKIVRKSNSLLKEHFIIEGSLHCTYHAACIRCLAPSKESINASFCCCFINSSLENSEEFKDLSDVYCDGGEMDLYFYKKGVIDLQALINEQVHLNISPRPLHSDNCKGLCSVCGFNLNFGKCIHQRSEKK